VRKQPQKNVTMVLKQAAMSLNFRDIIVAIFGTLSLVLSYLLGHESKECFD
jgi:hypothetical protein